MHRWLLPPLVALAGALTACNPPADPGKVAADAAWDARCNVPPDPAKTPPCPETCKLDNGTCTPDRGPPVSNKPKL